MKLLITTQTIDINDPILGFFHSWVKEFAKHFEHIHIICLKEGSHSLPENVTVHSLGKESGESRIKYTWRFYKYFGNIFFTKKVDYVFFHMGAIYNILAAPFFLIRKLKKTKFFWWKAYGHLKSFEHVALWFTDAVYTASTESFPIETKKRHVVGHAIDVDNFSFGSESRKGLVFVGRVTPVKRLEESLAVLAELNKRGHTLSLRIAGITPDKEYLNKLTNYINTHGLKEQVTFISSLTYAGVAKEYQGALIALNFSNTDSIDKVGLEAMLCGTLPITSTLAFKPILQPFGLFVGKDNPEESADVVEKILGMNETDMQDLRNQLRDIVINNHALKTFTKRVFE